MNALPCRTTFLPAALRRVAGLRGLLVVVLALMMLGQPARPQQMQQFDLRSASFQVPAGWTISYQSRDQEYDFISPDGRFQLWARWWFPDEPLLAFEGTLAHAIVPLAGQQALYIVSENGPERMLQLAFPQLDAEGEQFLFQLLAPAAQVPMAEHQALLEQLLSGLSLNGLAAAGAPGGGAGVAPPTPPQPVAPVVPVPQPPPADQHGSAVPVPQPSAIAPPVTVAQPLEGTRFQDATGAFSLPLPEGWTSYATEAAGLRQAVLLSPGRDALVLAALAMPEGSRSAAQVLEDFVALLYRDALVIKSIEAEAWPQIAGHEAHMVESVARVYAINSVAMPYPRGRVQVYSMPGADPAFLLVTIRGPEAPPDQAATLAAIVEGFVPGTAAAATAIPSFPVTAMLVDAVPVSAPPAATPGVLFDGRSLAGLHPLALSGADFAQDAELTPDGLRITFADGRGWAKAGFAASSQPITMPAPGRQRRLTASLDGANSAGLTLALMPPEQAGADPDGVHLMQVQFVHQGDGVGKVTLSLNGGAESADAKFPWPAGPAVFDVLIRPDRVVEIRDGAGAQLAELAYRTDPGAVPVVVQALLAVDSKNWATKLVLQGLTTEEADFVPPPPLDALVSAPTAEVELFNGMGLGRVWAGNARTAAHFPRFARLHDGALRIGWTPEDKASYVGIVSPETVLWLDGLHGMGEARLHVAIDPAATGDFEISLAGSYSLPGNLSSNDTYVLRFARQPDGSFTALSATRNQEKKGIRTEGLAALPAEITLVMRPGRVFVEAEGLNPGALGLPLLAEGAGLRVAVHAMADAEGRGALALRRIARSQTPAPLRPPATPAAGIAPLPEHALFTPPMGPDWQGVSAGAAEFASLSQADPGGITLMRRDPVPDWNRIALVGPAPAVALDYRIETTPYDLTLQVDPVAGLAARLFLSADPANFENSARVALSVRVLRDGPEAGALEIRLHTGHFSYDHWRRVLPADWWQANWDGRLGLRFDTDRIAVMLAGQPIIHGQTAVSRRDAMLYPAIVPGGMGKTDPGRVTLRAMTGAWVTPAGMDAAERMRLLDAASFDAEAFADLLAGTLKEDRP